MYYVHEGPWEDVGLALLGIDFILHVFYVSCTVSTDATTPLSSVK